MSIYNPSAGGGGNFGQGIIPFASWLNKDSVTIIGQTKILETSNIIIAIDADNDDVYAQDWESPITKNIVAGVGFDILLKAKVGTFKGNVKIDYVWS